MRLLNRMLVAIAAGLLCSVPQSQASVKHQIAAAELIGLFNAPSSEGMKSNSGAGVYYYLLSKLLEETGLALDYEIIVLPMKRAKMEFGRKLVACYAPGMDTFDPDERKALPPEVLSSTAFNHAVVKVLSYDKQELVTQVSDISKKDSISIVRGVPVSPEMQQMLDNAAKFYLVNSEYENLQMLMSKRVDHSLVFYPDVIAAYRQLELTDHFPFDPGFTPHSIKDNLICHMEHQAAFDKLEQAIQRYRKEGLLPNILQDYYLPDGLL